jgi:hypothetical protein
MWGGIIVKVVTCALSSFQGGKFDWVAFAACVAGVQKDYAVGTDEHTALQAVINHAKAQKP